MQHNPGFLRLVNSIKARVKECTVAELQARLARREQIHFIDIREETFAKSLFF